MDNLKKKNLGVASLVQGVRVCGLVGLCGWLLTGCATMHSKSISDIARGPGHRVSATEVGNGYFMLTLPELDSAARLRSECQGTLTGIQTTLTSRNWLGIVQIFEEKTEGWCQ